MSRPRATPFQRDYERMIHVLGAELTRVGAADEALTRRIVRPDISRGANVHVDNSTPASTTETEALRRCQAQEDRERYRDVAVSAIWAAIKTARIATDHVLRNEPIELHTGPVCVTKDCDKYASPHTRPDTNAVIDDVCDDCWLKMCPLCYLRPKEQYRSSCDACRKRAERLAQAEDAA